MVRPPELRQRFRPHHLRGKDFVRVTFHMLGLQKPTNRLLDRNVAPIISSVTHISQDKTDNGDAYFWCHEFWCTTERARCITEPHFFFT